ncbi:GNAT family N-acetyltransferase [Alkalihalobacterium bogoriense]|uniref:GNAT family N-acetyltransferase n=1 Tax=Alkalihalobacterium bogoriense TaxID=246272 RepID=UPI00047DF923|nr:GNAT family N-acetyltransferase [Alkalihalobacterium bogoriense]
MIRKANKDDLVHILQIVNDTIIVMKEEGNDQWNEQYPTSQIFQQDLEQGSLYVKEEERQIVGSITIDQNEAEEYNAISWTYPNRKAVVFHRLCVNPSSRKGGLATLLIQFAENYAKSIGVQYMKIDTYSLNKKAQQLFLKNGYTNVGEMHYQGKENGFYCYEKSL